MRNRGSPFLRGTIRPERFTAKSFASKTVNEHNSGKEDRQRTAVAVAA
jgi:hypothetical protein